MAVKYSHICKHSSKTICISVRTYTRAQVVFDIVGSRGCARKAKLRLRQIRVERTRSDIPVDFLCPLSRHVDHEARNVALCNDEFNAISAVFIRNQGGHTRTSDELDSVFND